MNILDEIYKRNLDTRRGKIHLFDNNWVFKRTRAQAKQDNDRTFERTDATGRAMYLVRQKAAWCNNSEKTKGYPKSNEHEAWYLPLYVCRKCEHHRKGKRRGVPRYPTCAWRASKLAEIEAVEDTKQAVVDAMVFVDEIMR